ncbi:hypothetical protein EDB86DRAFT_2828522 [Lactarius hatsudake]|nr:hypothetical protein EDB86DRAFT_2828522 [Lactarius hatsudake]
MTIILVLYDSNVSMTGLRALCSKGIPRVVTPARPATVTAAHRALSPSSSVIEPVAPSSRKWVGGVCVDTAQYDAGEFLTTTSVSPTGALLEHICWNAVGPASATRTTRKTGMRRYMTERAERLREVVVPSKFRGETAVRVSRQESDINGTSPPKRTLGLDDKTQKAAVVGRVKDRRTFGCGRKALVLCHVALLLGYLALNYAFPPALYVLAASLLGNFATPPTTLWDDKPVKHKWSATPFNWEPLGHPPAGTTIDLYIAPKHHNENGALIELL